MSDRDNSPEQKLQRELRAGLLDLEIPSPDADARRHAVSAALRAFDDAQAGAAADSPPRFQGFLRWLRPSTWESVNERNTGMFANPRILMGGVGAACVALLALGLVLQYQLPGASRFADPYGYPHTDRYTGDGAVEPGRHADWPALERPPKERVGREEIAVAGQAADPVSAPPAAAVDADPGLAQMELSEAPEIRAAQKFAAPATSLSFPVRSPQAELAAAPRALRDEVLPPQPGFSETGRDRFEAFADNPVMLVVEAPVSTFSIDVDTASYSFVRRRLNSGVLPQPDAVRVEELINYFDYAYPVPESRAQPFHTTVAVSDSPWAPGRKLVHIGIKGYELPAQSMPRSNLVFLLDVSGSMNSPDKLPLVKQSMELLLSTLRPDDTVSIAVYAGAAGTVLEPTPVRERRTIIAALDSLSAGGSTAGAQGIRLAYQLAESSFDENAVNRVILATDGDFNVGISSDRELQGFIERKRAAGIYLSVLGFGQGNYQDQLMQVLAQHGNGIAAYIDTLGEAQKVLVTEATSSLFPIATDVKIQVEFNPATVSEYRLIGYETRQLNREDFNNDRVDAGDIGAGHTVTAIYEITPVGSAARQIDPRRYTQEPAAAAGSSAEYAFLRLRYKRPGESRSQLIERAIDPGADDALLLPQPLRAELEFASAVAGFAQLLRGGRYTDSYTYDDVIALAQASKGADPYGYRTEFVQLVRKAAMASALPKR